MTAKPKPKPKSPYKKRTVISFENKVAAVAAINAGLQTNASAAKLLGCTPKSVYNWKKNVSVISAVALLDDRVRDISPAAKIKRTVRKPAVISTAVPAIKTPSRWSSIDWTLHATWLVALAALALSAYNLYVASA